MPNNNCQRQEREPPACEVFFTSRSLAFLQATWL